MADTIVYINGQPFLASDSGKGDGSLALATVLKGSMASVAAITNQGITAGGTVNGTAALGLHVQSLVVTLNATYNGSATAGCKLDLFGSLDGTNYDDANDPLTTDLVPYFAAGATIQKSWALDPALAAFKSIKAIVTNSDGSHAMTAVSVTFGLVP